MLRHTHPNRWTVGSWIRELEIDISTDPSIESTWELHLDSLITILSHADNLEAFRYHHGIMSSHLSCIRRISGANLNTLFANIYPHNQACIPLIGELESLRYLTIICSHQLMEIAPLHLPNLETLTVLWHGLLTTDIADFIFTSSYGRL